LDGAARLRGGAAAVVRRVDDRRGPSVGDQLGGGRARGNTVGSTNVLVDTEVEPEEVPPSRVTGRRVVRWVAVLAVGIVAVLACWQDPLYALPG
jgi:hypothetical protein